MFKILDLIIVFDFCSVIHHCIATEHFCTLFNMKNKIPFEPDLKGVKLFMENSHFKAPGFLQIISSISILSENKCLLSIYKIKQLDLKR